LFKATNGQRLQKIQEGKTLTPSRIEKRFVYYKHQKRKTYRSWGIGVANLETYQ
jgi:hypothetical protein